MIEHEVRIRVWAEPLEFFRDLVLTALKNQHVTVEQDVEYYLVALLAKYMDVKNLQKLSDDPLAIAYHKALQAGVQERTQILREIGDFSLYISGFFSDSLNRKLVDIDYYMAMGGHAYKIVSQTFAKSVMSDLFIDLADRFSIYTDIFAEVSDSAFSNNNRDVLRLYEKWLRTRSERLANLLKKEGLIPLDSLSTEII